MSISAYVKLVGPRPETTRPPVTAASCVSKKRPLAARGSLRALRLVHRRRRVGLPQRERIALGVRACREPPMGRNRHLLVVFPAQLAGPADGRGDVVGVW